MKSNNNIAMGGDIPKITSQFSHQKIAKTKEIDVHNRLLKPTQFTIGSKNASDD